MNEHYYIAVIAQLAQQLYRQPVYLDIDTGQLLRYDAKNEVYYPILTNGEPYPIWHFDKKRLIDPRGLLQSENFSKFQQNFSTNSDKFQTNTQENFSNVSVKNQKKDSKISDQTQQFTGQNSECQRLFNYYSITEFHQLYSEPIRSIALQIEKLTYELLKNTNKRQTIDKILDLYRQAQRQAEKGDEYHLRISLEKLQGKRQQQINMQQTRIKQQRRQRFWRAVKISLTTAALLLLFFGILYFNRPTRRQQAIKQAQNILQLNTYYLIAGSFSDVYNVTKFQRSLVRKGYLNTTVLVDTVKQLYRLAIYKTNNADSAKYYYNLFNSKNIKVWILKTKNNAAH